MSYMLCMILRGGETSKGRTYWRGIVSGSQPLDFNDVIYDSEGERQLR